MASTTLTQLEQLARRLSVQEQLELVEHITGRLRFDLPVAPPSEQGQPTAPQDRLQLAKDLLAEAEDIFDDSRGEFDSAESIRRIRDERIAQLCQSDA